MVHTQEELQRIYSTSNILTCLKWPRISNEEMPAPPVRLNFADNQYIIMASLKKKNGTLGENIEFREPAT